MYGSAWFGSVWGGIQGGIARVWDFPTEIVLSRTRTHLVPLNYWDRGSKFFCGGAYYGTLGSMAISIETLKKKIPLKTAWPIIAKKEAAGSRQRPKHFEGAVATKGFQEVEGRIPRSRCVGESHELPCLPLHR